MKEFLQKYEIGSDFPQHIKYRTVAAQYYRDKLRSFVKGEELQTVEPTLEEAKSAI